MSCLVSHHWIPKIRNTCRRNRASQFCKFLRLKHMLRERTVLESSLPPTVDFATGIVKLLTWVTRKWQPQNMLSVTEEAMSGSESKERVTAESFCCADDWPYHRILYQWHDHLLLRLHVPRWCAEWRERRRASGRASCKDITIGKNKWYRFLSKKFTHLPGFCEISIKYLSCEQCIKFCNITLIKISEILRKSEKSDQHLTTFWKICFVLRILMKLRWTLHKTVQKSWKLAKYLKWCRDNLVELKQCCNMSTSWLQRSAFM